MSTAAEIPAERVRGGNRRMLLLLTILPCCTLVFVFAVLVPLYNLLCTAGGAQMNPNDLGVAADPGGPTGRYLDIYFEPRVFDDLPVTFTVDDPTVRAEVGMDFHTSFRLKNDSDQVVHLRPIHLVSPPLAAQHFGMKVCFCFDDQAIEPGGERIFPVVFAFGRGLDERVGSATIGYTLLKTIAGESSEASQARAEAAAGEGVVVSPPQRGQP